MKPVKPFGQIVLCLTLMLFLGASTATAELVCLNNKALSEIHAQSGIVNVGIDSVIKASVYAEAGFQKEKPESWHKNFDQLNFGWLQEAPVMTLTDVHVSGSIKPGHSYTELMPEASAQFDVHCHFDNYQIMLDHFSAGAIHPAGHTEGPSFGAVEISGASMRISGDVYIGLRP